MQGALSDGGARLRRASLASEQVSRRLDRVSPHREGIVRAEWTVQRAVPTLLIGSRAGTDFVRQVPTSRRPEMWDTTARPPYGGGSPIDSGPNSEILRTTWLVGF
jgi:hypothetical protein